MNGAAERDRDAARSFEAHRRALRVGHLGKTEAKNIV
jgi:hypothetical protein